MATAADVASADVASADVASADVASAVEAVPTFSAGATAAAGATAGTTKRAYLFFMMTGNLYTSRICHSLRRYE